MSYTVKDFCDVVHGIAPPSLAMSWDNPGLLVGSEKAPVDRVLVALDATRAVIEEAKTLGAQLIVTHHPIIFSALRSLPTSCPAYQAAAAGIGVLCAHTNLDIAAGGVNDALAGALGLEDLEILDPTQETTGLGRVGTLPQVMPAEAFAQYVQKRLWAGGLRYVPGRKVIQRVAVCGGSGGEYVKLAKAAGAQALVTADVKHHEMLEAQDLGFTLIDAGHHATEAVVLPALIEQLQKALPDAQILPAKTGSDPARYLIKP